MRGSVSFRRWRRLGNGCASRCGEQWQRVRARYRVARSARFDRPKQGATSLHQFRAFRLRARIAAMALLSTVTISLLATDVMAQTPCEQALNSPPLSEIGSLVESSHKQHAGTGFGRLFDRTLEGKNCTFDEMQIYIDRNFKSNGFVEYSRQTNYYYSYRYKKIHNKLFMMIFDGISVTLVFDNMDKFVKSVWLADPL